LSTRSRTRLPCLLPTHSCLSSRGSRIRVASRLKRATFPLPPVSSPTFRVLCASMCVYLCVCVSVCVCNIFRCYVLQAPHRQSFMYTLCMYVYTCIRVTSTVCTYMCTCTLHEYMYKHMLNQLYIRTCVHVYTQFTSTSACNFYQVSVLKQHVISVSKET